MELVKASAPGSELAKAMVLDLARDWDPDSESGLAPEWESLPSWSRMWLHFLHNLQKQTSIERPQPRPRPVILPKQLPACNLQKMEVTESSTLLASGMHLFSPGKL